MVLAHGDDHVRRVRPERDGGLLRLAAYTAIGNVDASFNAHASIELTQVGIFWWTASYSGDAGNAPAVSGCGAGKVTASQVPAAITTTPGAGGPGRHHGAGHGQRVGASSPARRDGHVQLVRPERGGGLFWHRGV